ASSPSLRNRTRCAMTVRRTRPQPRVKNLLHRFALAAICFGCEDLRTSATACPPRGRCDESATLGLPGGPVPHHLFDQLHEPSLVRSATSGLRTTPIARKMPLL